MDVLSERFDEESGMYYDETEDEAIQSLQGMAEISKDEEGNE